MVEQFLERDKLLDNMEALLGELGGRLDPVLAPTPPAEPPLDLPPRPLVSPMCDRLRAQNDRHAALNHQIRRLINGLEL